MYDPGALMGMLFHLFELPRFKSSGFSEDIVIYCDLSEIVHRSCFYDRIKKFIGYVELSV